MPAETAQLTSLQSHGGMAITGSETVLVEGLPVHRLSDYCYCPIPPNAPHGIQPLVTSSESVFADALGVGRIGDEYA